MEINIDVDGVLAEFHPAFVKTAERVLGRTFPGPIYGDSWHIEETMGLTKEEGQHVWDEVCKQGWAGNLEETENGVSVVRRLATRHSVAFVTSPVKTSPTWHFDRMAWLHHRFGDVVKDYISTSNKYKVDGDILIEDNDMQAESWLQRRHDRGNTHAFVLLYARPYNAKGLKPAFSERYRRLNGWFEIEKFIEMWLGG